MPIIPLAGTSAAKGALVPIAQTRVTNTTTNEMGFTNIPAIYTDLFITASLRSTTSNVNSTAFISPFSTTAGALPANAQSVTFLEQTTMSTVASSRYANQDGMWAATIPGAGAMPNVFCSIEGWIFDYASITTRKASLFRSGWYNNYLGQQSIRAGQTRLNAGFNINGVSISTFSGSIFFAPGSIATLYGVRGVNQ